MPPFKDLLGDDDDDVEAHGGTFQLGNASEDPFASLDELDRAPQPARRGHHSLLSADDDLLGAGYVSSTLSPVGASKHPLGASTETVFDPSSDIHGPFSDAHRAEYRPETKGPFSDVYHTQVDGNFKSIEADDDMGDPLPVSTLSFAPTAPAPLPAPEPKKRIAASRRRKYKGLTTWDSAKRTFRNVYDEVMSAVGKPTAHSPIDGERTIYLNDESANQALQFTDNYVSTTKYNVVTFVPKFLIGTNYLL